MAIKWQAYKPLEIRKELSAIKWVKQWAFVWTGGGCFDLEGKGIDFGNALVGNSGVQDNFIIFLEE